MIVIFVFVQVDINDEVFLAEIVTFHDKFYLLYILVAYQDVYHSELHQNMCFSKVRVLVNECYLFLRSAVFRQGFLCF